MEQTPVNNLFGADLDSNTVRKFRQKHYSLLRVLKLLKMFHTVEGSPRLTYVVFLFKIKTERAHQKLSGAANVKTDWHTLANCTSPKKFHYLSLRQIFLFDI